MILRKGILQFLVVLLALTPLFGLVANQTYAATSRVAIIKELKGTVQVKKSGGSKQFKAFAKMSLNEGDVLTTSDNSTAVLQFGNGTSEDDRMSVAANTTLTFSKLSDRSGTRTKVSMFNGSAWVDVKSIASKNDEFTLETPTAIMGVRGTHLLVAVDPDSGVTRLTVAAGVVNTQPTGNGEPRDVKPGDNALVTKDNSDNGEVIIAPVDLNLLMKQTDKSIVEAIVKAAGEIAKENTDKLDRYFEGGKPQSADELARQKANVENLLGAIVDNALKSGTISQDRVNQLIKEAQDQSGVTIDLSKKTISLSDDEKRKQDEQKKKEEEARKAADEKRKADEQERKKNDELNKKLEAERKQREEANAKQEAEKKKKAQEDYEKQLSDTEKKRFKEDNGKLNGGSIPSTSPTGGSGGNPGSGGTVTTPAPAFLNSWNTTDNSGKQINWIKLNYAPPAISSTSTIEYLQTKVSENVNDIYMKLNFDATNYTVKVYSLNGEMGPDERTLSASNTESYTSLLEFQNALSEWVNQTSNPSLTSTAFSETPGGFYFPGLEVASWKTSGSTDTVPLPYNGSNQYALVLFPNSYDEAHFLQIAILHVQKAELPFHLGLDANGYVPIAQVGPGSFVANIDDSLSAAELLYYPQYVSFPVPMAWTVNGDNGVTLQDRSESEYYKNYSLSWNSEETKPGTTNISIHMEDRYSQKLKEDYQLSIYKVNTSDTSDLQMAEFKVVYGSETLTFDAVGNREFYDNIDDPNVTSVSILPEPVVGSVDEYDVRIYRNGILMADPNHATIGAGENEYDIVVRPKIADGSLLVYRINLYRAYPNPLLTDLKVDNVSIFDESEYYFNHYVPATTDSVAMSFTTNGVQGKWLVFKSNDSIHEKMDPSSANSYNLSLEQGRNTFIILNTSSYHYYTPYSIEGEEPYPYVDYYIVNIYRGVSSKLQNLTTNGFEIVGFDPNATNPEYTVTVTDATYYVSMTPIVEDPTAVLTVSVNGTAISDYADSIHLNVGQNDILINVWAEDGTENTYKITITRPGSGNQSDIDGIWFDGVPGFVFDPSVKKWTLTDVTADRIQMKLDKAYANASISVKFNDLSVGPEDGKFTFDLTSTVHIIEVVYNDGGNHVIYEYTVDRRGILGADGDATLSEISGIVSIPPSSTAPFDFMFNSLVLNYWYRLDHGEDSITITPVPSQAGIGAHIVSVTNGGPSITADGSGNYVVPLNGGQTNSVKVTVSSKNGHTLVYTFSIFRA